MAYNPLENFQKKYGVTPTNVKTIDGVQYAMVDQSVAKQHKLETADDNIMRRYSALDKIGASENTRTLTGNSLIDSIHNSSFIQGAGKNYFQYGASINKGLAQITPDSWGFKDGQKYWDREAKMAEANMKSGGWGLAGEIIGDPINLLPAGLLNKAGKAEHVAMPIASTTAQRIGSTLKSQAPRIGASIAGGAIVGSGTMVAKNYGDDSMTLKQKSDEIIIGALAGGVLNGIISPLMRVAPNLKGGGGLAPTNTPFSAVNAGTQSVADGIGANHQAFGLSQGWGQQPQPNGVQPQGFQGVAVEQAGRQPQPNYTPNFTMVPQNPPILYAGKQQFYPPIANGTPQQPFIDVTYYQNNPYPKVDPQYRFEFPNGAPQQQGYIPNFEMIGNQGQLPPPHPIYQHPRFNELLSMRENVTSQQSKSPQSLISPRMPIDQGTRNERWIGATYSKNYANDFEITKQDVANIRAGRITDEIERKLSNDLGRLDNDPQWQKVDNEYPMDKSGMPLGSDGIPLFANGGGGLGGAMGGASLGATGTAYQDIVEGKDVTTEDYLTNMALGATGGFALGKSGLMHNEELAGGQKLGLFAGERAKGFSQARKDGQVHYGKYDDMARFEIDDSVAKLKKIDMSKQNHTLDDVLYHPELFDNYPQFKDTKVEFLDEADGIKGYYDPETNTIGIEQGASEKEILSTLLHETQHVIQGTEGFARGGNMDEAIRELDKRIYTLEQEGYLDEHLAEKYSSEIDKLRTNRGHEAFKIYERIAGEIEAREVQARQYLTPEERKIIEPYENGTTYNNAMYKQAEKIENYKNALEWQAYKRGEVRFEDLNFNDMAELGGHPRLNQAQYEAKMRLNESRDPDYSLNESQLQSKIDIEKATMNGNYERSLVSYKARDEGRITNHNSAGIDPKDAMVRYDNSSSMSINDTSNIHNIDTTPAPPELIKKAISGDDDAYDALANAVFSRTFQQVIGKNTGDMLKPMILNKLIENPNIVEDLARGMGYKIKYFSANPENIGRKIGDTEVVKQPSTKQLKNKGYAEGNIFVYDPFDTHGSFNDAEYTKAWRGIHELAHAITEKIMQSKYGNSRRFGAMSFDRTNPYNKNDKRTIEKLSLENAQRAIEWEDVAFRTQLKLLDELGIEVNINQAINDFNIAGSDTLLRAITGDFSNPEKYGILPRSDNKRIDVRDALQFLENQEKANASYYNGKPSQGIDLSNWTSVSDEELNAVIKNAKDFPITQQKLRNDTLQLSIESIAGRTIDPEMTDMISSLPKHLQEEYHDEMMKALSDNSGSSLIAKKIGLTMSNHADGNSLAGTWDGVVNPSSQFQVEIERDMNGNITDDFIEKVKDIASVYAHALNQDGVGYHIPNFKEEHISKQNGMELKIGRKLSAQEAIAIEKSLSSVDELNGNFFISSTADGVRIINGSWSIIDNELFHELVKKNIPNLNLKNEEIKYFSVEDGLEYGSKQSEIQGKYSQSRRPDLQEWLNSHVDKQIERVNSRFKTISEQYKSGQLGEKELSDYPKTSIFSEGKNQHNNMRGGFITNPFSGAKTYSHLKKIVADELAKEWGDQNTFIKRWFVNTLSADYMNVRGKTVGDDSMSAQSMERMHYALSQLDESDRVQLHNFIAGDSKITPKGLEQLGSQVKADIDRLSRELIDNGVLTEDAYKEWAGTYIHRIYDKHFMKDVKAMMGRGFKIDEIKERGKNETMSQSTFDKKITSGEIDPALFQKPLSEGGMRLKVLPNGKVQLKRDWTMAERESMGEIRDASITIPETIMRLNQMVNHAKMLKEIEGVNGAVMSISDAKKFTPEQIDEAGFTTLPKSSRYGVLAGRVVRQDVAKDIKGMHDMMYREMFGNDSAGAKAWLSYLSLWKKSKTVWNAPSHVNNFISNAFLMHLSGMSTPEIVSGFGKSAKAIKEGNRFEEITRKSMIGRATPEELTELNELKDTLKYYDEAKQLGLFERSQLRDILRGQPQAKERTNVFGKMDKFAEDAYQWEDYVHRLTMYRTMREKVGMSMEEARIATESVMPDYTRPMPEGWRILRDTGVSPFISWTYYVFPNMLKLIKTKQGAKQVAKAMGTLGAMSWALSGINPIENIPIPFRDEDIPDDYKGRRIPVSGRNGDTVNTVKVDRWIPYLEPMYDPTNFAQSTFSGVTSGAVWAGMSGNQMYGNRPITRDSKSIPEQVYDYGKWGTQSFVPIPQQAYSGYNIVESMVRDEQKRRNNNTTKPRSGGEELLKFLGLNTMSYSKSGLKKDQQKDK